MTDDYKNRGRKISVTDNIQIQRHDYYNKCITIIDRATGETADLTEATLEVIIRHNSLNTDRTFPEFRANNTVIEYLCKENDKLKKQQEDNRSN